MALQRCHVFLSLGESIWNIRDAACLQAPYALVKQEQTEGEQGIFCEEESTSYWKKNFCSTAINAFIRFVGVARQFETASSQAQSPKDFSAELEKIEKSI